MQPYRSGFLVGVTVAAGCSSHQGTTLYDGVKDIDSIAPVSITAQIYGTPVPYRCQEFVERFTTEFLEKVQRSHAFMCLPLGEVIANEAYRALPPMVSKTRASPPGVRDLTGISSTTIHNLRREIGVDALLFVSAEYRLIELYAISQEYRLRVHIEAKLVVDSPDEPVWSTEFDDDLPFDPGLILGLQVTGFLAPTNGQWVTIMDEESNRQDKRAVRVAGNLAESVAHGFRVARGKERPGLLETARSSQWGKLGEWRNAWSALLLWLGAVVAGLIFGGIYMAAAEGESVVAKLTESLFALPALASLAAYIAGIWYILKALF